MNKIIKAYRIYRDRQTKYRSINYTTDINAISNLNTNINVYPNKNNKNNLFNNINQDNTNNQKTKDEDLDENLNIDNTITRNNEYLIHNSNNNNQNLNSNFSQEQYVTEQSSSSQSFTKTINYIGERDSDGLKKGFGIEQRGDGTIFKGIYKNDKLEVSTGDNLKRDGPVDTVYSLKKIMDHLIMGNGWMICYLELVLKFGKIIRDMKVNIIMVLKMDLGLI